MPLLPLELAFISTPTKCIIHPLNRLLHTASRSATPAYPLRLSLNAKEQSLVPSPTDEASLTQPFLPPISTFSEKDLKALYRDVLRIDVASTVSPSYRDKIVDPSLVLPRLSKRIVLGSRQTLDKNINSLSSRLQSRHGPSEPVAAPTNLSRGKPYSELLNALQCQQSVLALPLISNSSTSAPIVNATEWASLVDACIRELDFEGVFLVLRAMKTHGQVIEDELHHHIMSAMADEGLFHQLQTYASEFLQERDDMPHFQHIVTALCKCRLFSSAIQLLHQQEAKGHLPPMAVYHSLILGLLHTSSPGAAARQAIAWNIFYHMRYVAHPIPSVQLYTDMIRACAHHTEPDTLRGFDLWTEMTVDKRLTPTVDAYNAIILLAARDNRTAHEAIRLAREMLDVGRDADGKPALPLNTGTYAALLESCKHTGDLLRARWALTKLAGDVFTSTSSIDHWTLSNLFHAYASYKVPFVRDMAAPTRSEQPSLEAHKQAQSIEQRLDDIVATTATQSSITSGLQLPQTSKAVLNELDTMMDHLIAEKTSTGNIKTQLPRLFDQVTNLNIVIRSFLRAYFIHAHRVSDVFARAQSIHRLLKLDWSHEVIRLVLSQCARTGSGSPSQETMKFAEELWSAWLGILEKERHLPNRWTPMGLNTPADRREVPISTVRASHISMIWSSFIRLKTRYGDVDGAVQLLKQFERLYPPSTTKTNLDPHMPLETKISLEGPRTLIKVVERGKIDDDTIPPVLVFTDIVALHKRLARDQRTKDINYLTYLLHAYAGNVRDRRSFNLAVNDLEDGWRGKKSVGSDGEAKVKARIKWEKRRARVASRVRTSRDRKSVV